MSVTYLVLALCTLYAVALALGPATRVLWCNRMDLLRAAYLRCRYPQWWAEEKAAMKASGEWR